MKTITVLMLLAIALFLVSCQKKDDKTTEITNISTTDLQQKLATDNTLQILDVRTPEEWEGGIIKGALKINFFDADFLKKTTAILDKDKIVYVYCRSGNRSRKACKILVKNGYKVCNVLGGYKAWVKL